MRNRERDLLVEKNCYSRRRFCTTEKLHCWSTEWLVVILNLKPSMYDIPWDLRHVCWPNSYSHYCRLSLSNGKNIPTVISFVNICMNYHSIFFFGWKKIGRGGWLVWHSYLDMTIIASYPFSGETLYSRSVRNSLIILLDCLEWRWNIRNTNTQLVVETRTQVLKLTSSVSYQPGHPNVDNYHSISFLNVCMNISVCSICLHYFSMQISNM